MSRGASRSRRGREIEIAVVAILGFGVFVWNSSMTPVSTLGPIEPRALLWLVRFELAMTALIALFLWLRGWRLRDFPFRLNGVAVLATLVIFAAEFGLRLGLWEIWKAFDLPRVGPSFERQSLDGALSAYELAALAIVNGAYEEWLLLGYLCAAPMSQSLREAPARMLILPLLLSLVIRLSYHIYQGPFGVTHLALVGLVMSAVFLWTRNLAPVIIAHIGFDALGLAHFLDT